MILAILDGSCAWNAQFYKTWLFWKSRQPIYQRYPRSWIGNEHLLCCVRPRRANTANRRSSAQARNDVDWDVRDNVLSRPDSWRVGRGGRFDTCISFILILLLFSHPCNSGKFRARWSNINFFRLRKLLRFSRVNHLREFDLCNVRNLVLNIWIHKSYIHSCTYNYISSSYCQ